MSLVQAKVGDKSTRGLLDDAMKRAKCLHCGKLGHMSRKGGIGHGIVSPSFKIMSVLSVPAYASQPAHRLQCAWVIHDYA